MLFRSNYEIRYFAISTLQFYKKGVYLSPDKPNLKHGSILPYTRLSRRAYQCPRTPMQNYHFKNIESFFNISYETICKLQKPRSVATSCQDILMEYFREHEMLDAAVDGRMTILPPAAPAG